MDFLETFRLSFTALKANKVRSVLTMLGIIIGVSAVILLISLGSGLKHYITDQFDKLGSNMILVMPGKILSDDGEITHGPPNFAGSKLTLKQADDIKKLGSPITNATPSIEMPVSAKYGNTSRFVNADGITEGQLEMSDIKIDQGRGISKSDVDRNRKIAVIGPIVMEKLFNNNDPIGKKILLGDRRYEIVGITESIGSGLMGSSDPDNNVYIPITSAMDQFGMDNVQVISVKVADKDDIEEGKAIVKRYLSRKLKEDDFTVTDMSSMLDAINSILGVLTMALGGIAAISLVVGGIGIMNIMLVSVTERTKEIGLRKAVGAKSTDILLQFLTEAVVLCLFGGAIGILIGFGGSIIARKWIPAIVPLWAVLLAFGFSAAVGIIFGVAPAYKASKLDPIKALRYE